MTTRSFDLNIEEVLENWEIEHAIREVIANALDKQLLTKTSDIQISKDKQGHWHIRDFGRGLKITHFTLNENREKLDATNGVIGKFGVGLKDALATFHRRGIRVEIQSPYGEYRLKEEGKYGFDNIVTLHVEYDEKSIPMKGTDFILHGVADFDMNKAKSLFLKFANEQMIETNQYGQILERSGDAAKVYILGVFASEEPNFLFSYNITNLTDAMKKRLNRERLNVGRATYSDRVKAILRSTKSKRVESSLINQIEERAIAQQSDEMAWIEISQMALTLMHQRKDVVYFTEQQLQLNPDILDNAKSDGYQVILITEQQKSKLDMQAVSGGMQVRTIDSYILEYNQSFQYKFVKPSELSTGERRIFDRSPDILVLVGITKRRTPQIKISETMRVTSDDTEGVWDPAIPAIVIKRSKLSTLVGYAATLLHEAAHATTGASDLTREFEGVLTDYLGNSSVAALGQE